MIITKDSKVSFLTLRIEHAFQGTRNAGCGPLDDELVAVARDQGHVLGGASVVGHVGQLVEVEAMRGASWCW
jgi:hypothetical protein